MKLPKATKLPSGNWRIQLQIDGNRRSVTAPTKKEAQEKAKLLFAGYETEKRIPLTLGRAIDKYIEERENILAVTTIKTYKDIRKSSFGSIMNINVSDLTQSDIQRAISEETAKGKSLKTIKNAHGLLTATLNTYRPDFIVHSKFPQGKKFKSDIPDEADIIKIWSAAKGNKYEGPILLASWLGLRMSEIRGLKYSDISDGKLHIQRARVRVVGEDVEKAPKSEAGDRIIPIPKPIEDLIAARPRKTDDDYIFPYSHNAIRKGFMNICEEAGVTGIRFHDLRHFAASESLALGVPDKYSMKRMGHSTTNMLKTVYQHTMDSTEEKFSSMIDEHYLSLYNKA